MTFETICEEIVETIKNKKNPPHARVGAMELVCLAIHEVPERFTSDHLKPLVEACVSTTDDSDPKVREMGSLTLGSLGLLARKKGNKSSAEVTRLLSVLEATAPRVFKKVQSIMDGSTPAFTPAVPAATAPPASATSTTTVPTGSKPSAVPAATASKRPAASAAGGAGVERPSRSATGAAKASKESGAASAAAAAANVDGDEVDDLSMSLEEASSVLATELALPDWESTVLPNMDSAKWQEKSEAIAAIGNKVEQLKCGGKVSAALISFISQKTSSFKISNVAIMKAVVGTATSAAAHCGSATFHRPAAWELVKHFGDKYSDKRSKEMVDGLLTALVGATSAGFVVKRMKAVMDKTKAPQAHQSYLEWLKASINDVGATQFPVQFVCAFCKEELENKVAAVRTAAVEVLGALFNQLGPRMQAFAISDDMKPQIKSAIESEFAKVGYDAAAASARAAKASASGGGAVAGAGSSGLGDIPRQDLCTIVDKAILSELNLTEGKNSWQNRKTALESIIAACERSGHYLEANKQTVEVIKALKTRLNDTQANLKPVAAMALGHTLASFDTESAGKVLKSIVGGLLLGLGDNKKQMRDAMISALHMCVSGTANGTHDLTNRESYEATAFAEPTLLVIVLPSIAETLMTVSAGRQELLNWLTTQMQAFKPTALQTNAYMQDSCGELVAPLVVCLQDKMTGVRLAAEQCLQTLNSRAFIPKNSVDKHTRDLAPATKRQLQASIDKIMSAHGSAPAHVSSAADAIISSAAPIPARLSTAELPPQTDFQREKPLKKTASTISVQSVDDDQSVNTQSTEATAHVSGLNTGHFKKTSKVKNVLLLLFQ
jgi:cytoskeleton-associated protein 5